MTHISRLERPVAYMPNRVSFSGSEHLRGEYEIDLTFHMYAWYIQVGEHPVRELGLSISAEYNVLVQRYSSHRRVLCTTLDCIRESRCVKVGCLE